MGVDLIINGNRIYYDGLLQKISIAIDEGRIVSIGSEAQMPKAERTVEAGNKFVLPGGVDPHSHVEGYSNVGTIEIGSLAAAIGGTTTILDFSERKGDTDSATAAKEKIERFKKKSTVDFSLKPMMTSRDLESLNELEKTLRVFREMGIVAFKVFTTYERLGRKLDNYNILKIMNMAKKEGLIVQVHAEDNAIAEGNRKNLRQEEKTGPEYHALMKPNISEDLAITDVALLAKETGASVYIVHTSTMRAPEIINRFRNSGTKIYGETCPQYLILTDDFLKGKNGNEFICSPPLRKAEDNAALWRSLSEGKIQTVGSDHVPFTKEQKKEGIPFDEVPNGIPGIEVRLPLLFSEGVKKGKITIKEFVDVISSNPAKIFGIYPRKGTLRVGSDADVVIVDPEKVHGLSASDLHMGSDISVYEHITCDGWPIMTIARGEILIENDLPVSNEHNGMYLGISKN